MIVLGQSHFLTLAKGYLHIKLETWFSKGNRCGASRSTLNFVLSKTWRQENNCPQIGHMAFKYSNNLHGITHLFNVFAKFHGLSTVINFAKANRSVCVDQNVGKKLDVAASDEAALFYHTVRL